MLLRAIVKLLLDATQVIIIGHHRLQNWCRRGRLWVLGRSRLLRGLLRRLSPCRMAEAQGRFLVRHRRLCWDCTIMASQRGAINADGPKRIASNNFV